MALELLQKKIKTTNDLFEIVKTMKTLSSASILQYEQANSALEKYRQNIKDGFLALMLTKGIPDIKVSAKNKLNQLNILIGSDNSLVGRFNKDIIKYYENNKANHKTLDKRIFLTVGKKLTSMAEQARLDIAAKYPISNSVKMVNALAENIIFKIDELMQAERINQVVVYYHKYSRRSHITLDRKVILPIDGRLFTGLRQKRWDTNNVPLIPLSKEAMFSALLKETLKISLASMLNYSLAAEHYTRMTNMQNAQKNIEEKLEFLHQKHQQLRQENITDELIDVISGAEIMRKKD